MKHLPALLLTLLILAGCGEFSIEPYPAGADAAPTLLPTPEGGVVSTAEGAENAPTQTTLPTPEDGAVSTAVGIVGTPTPLGTPVPIDCPEPIPGETVLYRNNQGGYCLLVPVEFDAQPDDSRFGTDVFFQGPVLDPQLQESLAAFLRVDVIAGPGAAADYSVAEWIDEINAPSDPRLEVIDTVVLDGFEASVVLMPGPANAYTAYVIAYDTLYQIATLPPEDPEFGNSAGVDVPLAWNTMVESIRFFPPTDPLDFPIPAEVCPTPQEGTQAVVNRQAGLCYLIPAEFEVYPLQDDSYVGGPDLGEVWPGSPSQVQITSYYGGPIESSLAETITQRNDVIVEEFTLSPPYNLQTVVFDTGPDSPIGQRRLAINYFGESLEIVISPYDQEQFPDGWATAQEAWDLIVQTVAPFEPWR